MLIQCFSPIALVDMCWLNSIFFKGLLYMLGYHGSSFLLFVELFALLEVVSMLLLIKAQVRWASLSSFCRVSVFFVRVSYNKFYWVFYWLPPHIKIYHTFNEALTHSSLTCNLTYSTCALVISFVGEWYWALLIFLCLDIRRKCENWHTHNRQFPCNNSWCYFVAINSKCSMSM